VSRDRGTVPSNGDVFQQFTDKFQDLICKEAIRNNLEIYLETIQAEENKREELERRNKEIRRRIFNE